MILIKIFLVFLVAFLLLIIFAYIYTTQKEISVKKDLQDYFKQKYG